ncbi:hypothetical protein JXB27_00855 [Candidatus Woesearchaeota archaeon]|nr:hypothetical protein [Candidatus Woesearchaeota archaeon]
MNRKGDIKFIMFVIYLLIVFAILAFLMRNLEKGVEKITPNAAEKQEERTQLLDLTPTKESSQIFNKVVGAFKTAKDSPVSQCLVFMDEFSDIKKSNIEISYQKNEKGELISWIKLVDDEGRILEFEEIAIKPCIVAGKESENFYDLNFKNKDQGEEKEYLEVTSIIIAEKEKIIADGIKYDIDDNGCCPNSPYTDNKKVNLLYKPDKEHVCFIATRSGGNSCAVNEKAIDDDCISDGDIFLRIKKC